MPDARAVRSWPEKIRKRYENYLKTSFFFRDPELRASFQAALREEASLLKGPFAEPARDFDSGVNARDLARECFPETAGDLLPALMDNALHSHQERTIRAAHVNSLNVVVATGTASGKTESFLYPILFELYRQHLAGELGQPGVRAMILYPMNALANDQRERLGKIIGALHEADSEFRPTFGQYIGQTPEDAQDKWRNADWWDRNSLPGEQIFRKDMRKTPPHILLTNYSMLEYLLIRPNDSPLFDDGRGERWQFLVLDEAHQYRGAKGMEMGMLIRRPEAAAPRRRAAGTLQLHCHQRDAFLGRKRCGPTRGRRVCAGALRRALLRGRHRFRRVVHRSRREVSTPLPRLSARARRGVPGKHGR